MTPPTQVHPLPGQFHQLAEAQAGVQRDDDRGAQLLVLRFGAGLEEPRDLLLREPAQQALRLLLKPDAGDVLDGLPLLVSQPE